MQNSDDSASKQIRNLLIVIGLGVIGASLIAYFFINYYTPKMIEVIT